MLFRLLILLLFLILPADRAGGGQDVWTGVERMVAVGDVHGDYEQFVSLLESAGLINSEREWVGGRTHLVQAGDFLDHTRAFRNHKKLKNPEDLVKCDRRLLAALRKLDYETLTRELSPYLNKEQIKALLARRNRIVGIFDNAIAEKGEQLVLFDSPPRP